MRNAKRFRSSEYLFNFRFNFQTILFLLGYFDLYFVKFVVISKQLYITVIKISACLKAQEKGMSVDIALRTVQRIHTHTHPTITCLRYDELYGRALSINSAHPKR